MTDITYLSLEKLKTISLSELLKLKQNLDKAIEDLKKDKQEELINKLFKEAEENGISLEKFGERLMKNIVPSTGSKVPNKKPAKKYKDPNSEKTWCGNGRKPKWIEKWIEDGNDVNELLIEKSNQ